MINRKIKFRAWDEQNKVMHYNFQFIKSGEEGNDWIVFTSDKQTLKDEKKPLENPYFQQQLKIMQFTGVVDKNGKEVYEGDIIKEMDDIQTVFYNECYASFDVQYLGGDCDRLVDQDGDTKTDLKVLGNIYENPKLLKV